jgi:hypothetical protein
MRFHFLKVQILKSYEEIKKKAYNVYTCENVNNFFKYVERVYIVLEDKKSSF